MRTKLTLIALTLAVLVAGWHRKCGGYLAPAPANASVAR